MSDMIKLQIIIFIWGLTAVLGVVITLPAGLIIGLRSLFAAVILGAILSQSKQKAFVFKGKTLLMSLGLGTLLGLHWMAFFSAAKIANASVGAIGLSTTALWTAPIASFFKLKKLSRKEFIAGAMIMIGMVVIEYGSDLNGLGLILSLISAVIISFFMVLNVKFLQNIEKQYPHFSEPHVQSIIMFYELIGATISTLPFLFFYIIPSHSYEELIPDFKNLFWILFLAYFCTVYTFTNALGILKRIGAFKVNIFCNLEPIYSVILAAIFLNEDEQLHMNFYIGSGIILLTILLYTLFEESSHYDSFKKMIRKFIFSRKKKHHR